MRDLYAFLRSDTMKLKGALIGSNSHAAGKDKTKKEKDKDKKSSSSSKTAESVKLTNEDRLKLEINKELNEKFNKLNRSKTISDESDLKLNKSNQSELNLGSLLNMKSKETMEHREQEEDNDDDYYQHENDDFYYNSLDLDINDELSKKMSGLDTAASTSANSYKCKCCTSLAQPPSGAVARNDLVKQLKLYLSLLNKAEAQPKLALKPNSSFSSLANKASPNQQQQQQQMSQSQSLLLYAHLKQRSQQTCDEYIDDSIRTNDESFMSTLHNESVSVMNSTANKVNMYIDDDNEENKEEESCASKPKGADGFMGENKEEDEEMDETDEDEQTDLNCTNDNISNRLIGNRLSEDGDLGGGFSGKCEKLKPLIPLNVYYDVCSGNGYGNQQWAQEPFIAREWVFKEIDKVRFFISRVNSSIKAKHVF